jgi:hypothetical protein
MKRLITRRRAITVALTIGALLTGVAFANWVATGTGSGKAYALTATASTVASDTGTSDLYPSSSFTGDLFFTVDNPNPYPVKFTDATLGAVTSSNEAACPAANVTTQNATGLNITVPANTVSGVSRSVADVAKMSTTAPDGCQGKSFTVVLNLAGTQQ